MTLSAHPADMFADDAPSRQPTSDVIANLVGGQQGEWVTLETLIAGLGERSFGIILLFFALFSLVPGASGFIGVLLLIPAVQMILAHDAPTLPRFARTRRFRVTRVVPALSRVVPWLHRIERVVRPRWPTPFITTKRVVGAVILLLALTLIAPIPLSNYVPGIVIALIAIAYLEEDGILLLIALVGAAASLAITGFEVWGAIGAAHWLSNL